MATFSDIAKNIFWALILLQFAPIFIQGIVKQYYDLFEPKTKVGVIKFEGMLANAEPRLKEIKKFFTDTSIKAIILKIESPGGVSGTSQTLFNEINHFRKEYPHKYVIALVENVAASGGYYVAMAADYIIASPSAIIGSIGVFRSLPNLREFIEYHKIKYDAVTAGKYKGMGNFFLPLTPEQKAHLQESTNDTYRQFVRDVAQRRPQLPADTKVWAEGKIFTGEQALALKLIDAVGSPATALQVLKDKAHIEGPIEWVKPAKRSGFFAALSGESDDSDSTYIQSFVNSVCSAVEQRYGAHAWA